MKKALLLLLLVASLPTLAQIQLTAVFDYANPTGLNPSMTPMDYEGGKLNVFDKIFEDGKISMSFSSGVARNGGAQIVTRTVDGLTYSLRLTSGTLITFTAKDGATINSITWSDDSSMGDLSNRSTGSGVLEGHTWTATSSNVTSVQLFTDGGSEWKKITVNYTALKNALKPSISLAGQVPSFKSVNLTFDSDMKQVSTSGICLTGTGIDGSKALDVNVSGKVVTLSLPGDEEITTDGDFVLHVPAGSFEDPEGYANVEIAYAFSVFEPRNSLKVVSITPESETIVEELPDPIKVEFDKAVKVPAGTVLNLTLDGEYVETLENIYVAAGNRNQIVIRTKSNTKYGTYVINVPEGTVHTTAYGTNQAATYDRWNAEFDITYTIQDPYADLKDLITEVNTLKSQIGSAIGYPVSGSNADKAIDQALDDTKEGTTKTHDEQKASLEAAIAAFYAETNVVMPAKDSWYYIKGVNGGKETEKKECYLAYSEQKVTIVTSQEEATPFQAVKSETSDSLFFKTADGRFITILPSTNDNTTPEPGKKNGLDVKKLLIDGVDNEDVFALFYIIGWQGRDAGDNDLGFATEAIDYTNNVIVNHALDNEGKPVLHFDAAFSSAFTFVDAPNPTLVDPEIALSATSILTTTESIVLTFKNLSRVELKDVKKVYFSSDELGEKKVETTSDVDILTKSDKEENSFIVHLNGLNNPGIYYLQMPEGTFDYSNNDKLVTDVKLAAKFSLTEPEPQFNATYDLYSVLQVIERNSHAIDIISDVDLNDLVIMAQVPRFYNALVPNPNAVVEIVNAYNMANVVGRGHFEEYPTFAEDYPQYYADGYTVAIKLVMDEPVAKGALQNSPDTYSYHIPEAAFGDANFKLYLENPESIKKEDCIVNPGVLSPHFLVDNDRATPTTKTYTLSITATGNGSATYDETSVRNETKSFTVNEGTNATVSITPDDGYRIKSVKENDSDVTSSVSNNTYTINNISSNTTLEVEFEAIPVPTYTLSITATGNGSATYDETSVRNETKSFTVNEGTNATVTFSPDDGNSIASVNLNGSDVTSQVSENSYTISNITADTTLTVTFQEVSAISNHVIDGDSSKVIFDLQGRRVQSMNKKGVYIVNGQKIVIK